jgi:hypothetical protein
MVWHSRGTTQLLLRNGIKPTIFAAVAISLVTACPAAQSTANVPVEYGVIDPADIPSDSELQRSIRCDPLDIPIVSLSRSLRDRACELVKEARAQIASGRTSSLGLQPADTSALRCVLITRPFVTRAGDINPRSALVAIRLDSRDFSIVAAFGPDGRLSGFSRSEYLDNCPPPGDFKR